MGKRIVAILSVLLIFGGVTIAQKPEQGKVPAATVPQVRFYPNPAVNFITFELKEPVERGTTLQVFSFLGRQVSSIPVNAQRVTVNITEYFRGIYVFQLRSPSGKILETNKFQVNK